MGLGDADLLDDAGGGGSKVAAPATVSCSICLEVVSDNGDRSLANLQCGHQFHLDCIGSAFNIKGAMQCPNCRKIEKGQWLYAHGSRALPEFSMDDWAHDEDMYDLSYSEMAFGVHWCPFSGLTRLPSSFDEGEFSSSAYHDLIGHHAIFTEHTTMPSTNHPCPYIAYVGPIHPSSSASNSSASVADGSNFNNHWSGPSVDPNSYAFPSMDLHYRHPSPFATTTRIGGADQPSIPARSTSNIPRNGMHPFILGHSSGGRAPAPSSTVTSSMVPPYPGTVARPRSSLQAYFQQQSTRRSSQSHRGLPQIPPIATSSDPSSGFYFFSSSSSGRTFQEAENPHRDRVHVDRDLIWGPFHPSSSFRQRRTSERMPSHNQR